MRSKLPNSVLRRVWVLADIDQDGMLDSDEFAVAMFLIDHKLSGNDIPESLPERLIPPSKKIHRREQYRREEMSVRGDEPPPGYSANNSGGPPTSYGGGSGATRSYGGPSASYSGGGSYGVSRGRSMEQDNEDEQDLSSFVDGGH